MDPRVRTRRVAVTREAGRRRLGVVVGLFSAALLLTAAVLTLHSSLFSVRHVVIKGNTMTTSQEILGVSGLERHPPLIDVSTARIVSAIERLPWIDDATVSRAWPDAIDISVTERNPVADFAIGAHRFAIVDATGRVLATDTVEQKNLVAMTFASTSTIPGSILNASGVALSQVAASVPVSMLGSISTVEESTSGVEMVLRSGTIVEIGQASELRQKMTALATLLATSTVTLGAHSSVDLRVPDSPVVTSS
jgi:cell division protein FtsQ